MNPDSRDHLNGHVVVWIAQVSREHNSLSSLDRFLDDRERARAERFRFPEDRARFVLGRSLVKTGLGHYLQIPAASIELSYTDRDRPIFLANNSIQFSISHTQDLVAVAFTSHAHVGIDVEFMQAKSDLLALAKRILSDDDYQKFQTLPATELTDAFFRIWTRKEAYLKASGEGITDGLQKISVSFSADEITSVQDSRNASNVDSWRLITLPTPAMYKGSVACDDIAKKVDCHFVHFENGEIVRDSSPRFG